MHYETLAMPVAGEVLVRTTWSGISRGTEVLVTAGQVPPSQYRTMAAPLQAGSFPFPVKYGYAAVGIVEEGPEDLRGRNVFCLHPHQDLFVVSRTMLHVLPDDLPPERAVLAANMETALNGLWDAHVLPGDRVMVLGAGVVGLLLARLADHIPGAEAVIVDPDRSKEGIAKSLGLAFASEPPSTQDFDAVIECSGAPAAARQGLSHLGFEGRLVIVSWYGDREVPLPLGEAFHSRRLSIVSSQVGNISAPRRGRWSHARRMEKALALLCEPKLDMLISGESAFEDLPEVMRELATDSMGALCHRIRYGPSSKRPAG